MSKAERIEILPQFAELEDPRQAINQAHKFIDILVIAVCAAVCGADDWVSVAMFGRAKESWFRTFLELPNGIPAHDTFWRIFRALDPEQFEHCFRRWIHSVQTVSEGEVVAVDGKQLRRSFDAPGGKAALQMVSAWASDNQMVLGQRQVDGDSNEITAIPALLEMLWLQGSIVTIDAIGCQTEIAATIVEQEADYLLALKDNQPRLHEDVRLLFDTLADDLHNQAHYTYPHDYAKSVDKDHGRIEVRHAWTITKPELIAPLHHAEQWPNLSTLVKVQAERYSSGDPDHHAVHTRYYISSATADAETPLQHTRTHWSVENSLHWVLDMAFREDEARLRKEHGAHNFALLRHMALNLLKQEETLKVGIKNKRLRAGWDHDYLLAVLQPLLEPV